MLDPNAFMRSIPRVFDLETRLRLEAIVNSTDTIQYSFDRLSEALSRLWQTSLETVSDRDRAEIATDCWSIVDHAHALFQMLRKATLEPDGRLQAILSDYGKTVKKMRDAMDHIHEQIPNIAKRKTSAHPIYGAISFTTPIQPDGSFNFLTFMFGGIQLENQIGPIIDTQAAPVTGVGNIVFAAYGYDLQVSEMVPAIGSAIKGMNNQLETRLKNQLRDYCEKNGDDFDALLSNNVKGTAFISIGPLVRPTSQ